VILASFNRVITIGTLCCSYSLPGQGECTKQQDSSIATIQVELEEVEAVAELPAELESASLKPLLTITAREIDAAPSTALEDLLEYMARIDIRHRGKHGTQADLTIQGGSFDQSMVLLNGINISDPQTGHFQLNLPVDLSALSRVEMITGSATRRFGIPAFNGAINLVTRPEDSTSVRSGFRYGQHSFYKAQLHSNFRSKHLFTLASASTSGSKGYRENTDFRNTHVYLHTCLESSPLKAHLMMGLNSKEFGANAFYSPLYTHQYEETTTGFTALKLQKDWSRTLLVFQAYFRFNSDYFLLDRYDPSFYRNDHQTRVTGTDFSLRFSSRAGITFTGIHFRNEQIISTSLGEPFNNSQSIKHQSGITFTHGYTRSHVSWNINHIMEGDLFSLAGGVMVHINSDLGYPFCVFPGIDLAVKLPSYFQIFTSLNHSMRLPTFTDLYYQDPSNMGNPDLSPERATTLELGICGEGKRWEADINGFFRQGREMIDWIWMEDQIWHATNLTQIDALGGDANLHLTSGSSRERWFHLDSWNFSYTFTRLTKISDEVISRYLLDNLRHKVVMAADLIMGGNLSLSGRIVFQDRNGSYLVYDDQTGSSHEKLYDPFLLLDMKLAWSFGRMTPFMEATNLLNITYRDIGDAIQPGRWMVAGIEIR